MQYRVLAQYVAACLLALLAMTASVSANPPDISDLVTARDAFTQSQIDRLERYAEHWANELASGQSDRMNRARRELLDQLRAPGVRRIFLDEYARAVVPQMQRLIERDPQMDGSQFIAINAIQIIGMLQSEMAVRPLLEYANPEREDRSAIRLWAVNGFRLVVESGNVTDRRTDGFVRDLHRLAERETDWMVLMRHFQAMAVVQTEVARERQVELLSRVVSRIEEDESGPSELMRVVSQSLLLLREQYISPTISASEQTTLGRSLGPVLGRILAVADQHWDAAKANESSREQYGSAIRIAEILLRAVDSRVRSGSSVDEAIEQAWSSNNQSQYRSGVSRWQSVLSRSPYSQ